MKDRRKTAEEQKRQRETRRQLEEENVERMLKGEKPIFKTKGKIVFFLIKYKEVGAVFLIFCEWVIEHFVKIAKFW